MTLEPKSQNLTEVDRQLLNILQNSFPVCQKPYASIGKQLGLTESDVINRIRKLKANRIIRRIGGVFDARGLGFNSTLVALKVDEEAIGYVTAEINKYPGVTHNYQRQHEFNVWFTMIASSADESMSILDQIKSLPGVKKLRNLPAVKQFKINVSFDMTKE
jgi:siroheme decarboxylase